MWSPAEVLLTLSSLLPSTVQPRPAEVLFVAQVGCAEAGRVYDEVARVYQVAQNRARLRDTSLLVELRRPYQFAKPSCRQRTRAYLTWRHIALSYRALRGENLVPKLQGKITHFATKRALRSKHSRCEGYTIGEVWRYAGLRPVLTTRLRHVFFKRIRHRAGCPPPRAG